MRKGKKKQKIIVLTGPLDGNSVEDYFDDCPICQEMKRQGIKMESAGDDQKEDLWSFGLGISKIPKDKVEKIKDAFEKTKN